MPWKKLEHRSVWLGEGVTPEVPQQSLDLRDYLRPLRNRWWLIVITVVVVTAGTYLYYDRQPEIYSATSQLFVESSSLDEILFGSGGERPAETIDDLSLLLQTTPVAETVAEDIGYRGDPRALLGSVSAAGDGDSSFIFVTAQGQELLAKLPVKPADL